MNNYIFVLFKIMNYSAAYLSYKKRLCGLLGAEIRQIDKLYKELWHSEFMGEITRLADKRRGFWDFSMLSVLRAPSIYVICRAIQPRVVLETGVSAGFSSAFILYALEKNNRGNLYSIDLPNQPGQEIPMGRDVGWIIPARLKQRWELTIGSSKEKLPVLLPRLNKINIFYHDSDHNYKNMLFELNAVWDFLEEGGLLLSDDITENRAFDDFCRIKGSRNTSLFKLGIIKK